MNKHDEDKMIEAIRKDDGDYHLDKVLAKAKDKKLLSSYKRAKWLHVLIPVFSAIVALSVAVPVTWSITRKATKDEDLSSQLGGAALTNDVLLYMKNLAAYHYGSSIGTLIDSGVVYADLYYAFDSININYLVIAVHSVKATRFDLYSGGYIVKSSSSSISSYYTSSTDISLTIAFYKAGSLEASIDFSVDLKPYFDSLQ